MKKRMVYAVLLCTAMLLTACSGQNSDVSDANQTDNLTATDSMTDPTAATEGKTDDNTDSETESKETTKTAVEPSSENTEESEGSSENKSSASPTEQHNSDASDTEHENNTVENKITSPEQIIWEEAADVPDKEDIMIPEQETQQKDTLTTPNAQQAEEIPPVVTEKVIELPFIPAN